MKLWHWKLLIVVNVDKQMCPVQISEAQRDRVSVRRRRICLAGKYLSLKDTADVMCDIVRVILDCPE